MLKLLMAKGASIRDKDNEGQTAVHLCTRHKSPKCMALLLRQLSPGEIDDQDRNKVCGTCANLTLNEFFLLVVYEEYIYRTLT